MATQFALIQAETVAQLFPSDPQLNAALDVRDVSNVPGIEVGWHVDENGAYHPPEGYTWEQARTAAANELTQTQNICVRCLERQQTVPNDWIIYRDTLRAIRDAEAGDPTASFPPRPVYPPDIDPPPGFPPGEVVWPPPAVPENTYMLPSGAPQWSVDLPTPERAPGAEQTAQAVRRPKRKLFFGMG